MNFIIFLIHNKILSITNTLSELVNTHVLGVNSNAKLSNFEKRNTKDMLLQVYLH